MTSPEPALTYSREEHVASITFNRPAVLNAIDVDIARLFRDACRDIAADSQVRVVVLRGSGRSFVAGGDLQHFVRDPASIVPSLIDPIHEAITLLSEISAPVVGSLHGAVAGAGFSLALACDLAIATEGTRFNFAYPMVGTSCDASASWTLPRIVGLRKALEIALLSPVLDATQALQLGLINWVVPDDQLQARTDEVVARLAAGPPIAFGHLKRLMRTSFSRDVRGQLLAEREAFAACAATSDFAEAVRAFFEKRPASYRGN